MGSGRPLALLLSLVLAATAGTALPACFWRSGGDPPASMSDPRGLPGIYRSQLPVPEQADRSITLTLSADGHARLEVVVDRGETTTSRGFWRAVDGRLTVMVDRLDGRGRGPLVFEIEEGRLVPTSFDGALYGEQPIPLVRR